MTTIAALIYASPRYASHLWDMLRRTTPELEAGEARFFFVANDPTDEVLDCLRANAIPYIEQRNPRLDERTMEALGYGKPEYIRRVYQGWNRAVREATSDCLVLLNSDHVLRPGWLAGLRGAWTPDLAVSPLTIEPAGPWGIFRGEEGGTGATRGEHGRTLDTFDAGAFETHARSLECDVVTQGGAFQPVMVSRQAVIDAGLYPEGNLHAGRFDRIAEYGDRHLFRRLAERGVRHVTYHGVVVYHFHEGEMRESQRAKATA